jgi:Arc/MetJ-type ribon-helix-helix transcriptional regulator
MPTLNTADSPRSITLCLQPRQLGRLDALVTVYRNRAEYVSRSALVRQALNLGLDVMLAHGADDDTGTEDDAMGVIASEATSSTEVSAATP